MPTLTLAFKGKTLQVFPVEEGLLSIGRDDGCDIHIDSLAVEPQHARIMLHNDTCTLTQGKHDNPTFVNHKPIQEHVLEHNDMIRIGKHTLQFRDEHIQPQPQEEQRAQVNIPTPVEPKPSSVVIKQAPAEPITEIDGWLQIMSGKNLGKTFKLRTGLTDLGKLGMAPALIALRRNGYVISSLTDNDKLSVDDREVGNESYPLNDGDLIKIGKVTLQFHLHA